MSEDVRGTGVALTCACCGKECLSKLVCSQCKSVGYCSPACQKKDWKAGHRAACLQNREHAPATQAAEDDDDDDPPLYEGSWKECLRAHLAAVRSRDETLKEGLHLVNEGTDLHDQNRHDEALSKLLPALCIGLDIGAGILVVAALSAIGRACLEHGRHADAELVLREAIRIRRAAQANPRSLGLDEMRGRKYLQDLIRLSLVYENTNEPQKVLEALKECLPQIELLKSQLKPRQELFISVHRRMAIAYAALGKHDDAIKSNQEVVRISRKAYSKANPELIDPLSSLAVAYAKSDREAEALEIFEELLGICRASLGEDDTQTRLVRRNIKILRSNLGMPTEVLQAQKELHRLDKREGAGAGGKGGGGAGEAGRGGGGVKQQLDKLEESALSSMKQGDHTTALETWREVLRIRRETYGDESKGIPVTLDHIASAYQGLGDGSQEMESREEALSVTRKRRGGEHREVEERHEELAERYGSLGMLAEQERHLREKLRIRRSKRGNESSDVGKSHQDLAIALMMQKRHSEACVSLEEALRITRKAHGEEGEDLPVMLRETAVVYREMGMNLEALRSFEEALPLLKKRHGDEHADVADIVCEIGDILIEEERYPEAIESFEGLLRIARKSSGDVRSEWTALHQLGVAYSKTGKDAEAIEHLEEAIVVSRKLQQGEDGSPPSVHSLSALATVYEDQGKHEKALERFREALHIEKETNGSKTVVVGDICLSLANLEAKLGDQSSAEKHYEKAHKILTEGFEDGRLTSKEASKCLELMGTVCKELGWSEKAKENFLQAARINTEVHGPGHPETQAAQQRARDA